MKILIPVLGGFGKAGGWRVLSQLGNYWLKDNNEVTFLAFKNSTEPYFPTKAQILYYDSNGDIDLTNNLSYPKPFFGVLSMRKSLKKAIDKIDADFILANHSLTAYPVSNSKNSAKKFYYVQAYEPDYYLEHGFKNKIFYYLSKKSYELDLNIIVNSYYFLDYKEIKSDIVVFPGLDLEIFRQNQINKYSNDKFILGTIGRIEKYKGTMDVLKGFRKLRKEFGEKVELHIAFGDKSLKEDGVKIIDVAGDIELAEYYKSLNVYICGGLIHLEAVHYPVIEAMACGVPVVTTGYYPSNKENTWLISINNSDSIVEQVKNIMDNPKLIKIKTDLALDNIKQFDWELVSKKMFNHFNSAIKF